MDKFQQGYQAALADITAVMENAGVGEDHVTSVAVVFAVQEWISNNTVSETKSFEYRGYWVHYNEDEKTYECYGSSTNAANLVDMIDFNTSARGIKRAIDRWSMVR